MSVDLLDDTWRCGACGFMKSTLPVRINEVARLDEAAREKALKPIRLFNYEQLFALCADLLRPKASLLDVGCAHGWFLAAAKAKGFHAKGIEPDRAMADRALAEQHDVIVGYFPDALSQEDRFDAITFNDVFEHLPDPTKMAAELGRHLNPGGLVIISLPVSDGLIFRLARLATRIGMSGPYRRMWQEGLPSPHLSYFSAATLPRLMSRVGFTLLRHGPLQAIRSEGLYERIRYDRNVGSVQAMSLYSAARVMAALSRVAPSDTHCFVFQRS
jgi:SAM-dependent methyltransferase